MWTIFNFKVLTGQELSYSGDGTTAPFTNDGTASDLSVEFDANMDIAGNKNFIREINISINMRI